MKGILLPKIVTVSRAGQITIPVAYRRRFGLTRGQKVRLTVRNGAILVRLGGTVRKERSRR